LNYLVGFNNPFNGVWNQMVSGGSLNLFSFSIALNFMGFEWFSNIIESSILRSVLLGGFSLLLKLLLLI
jgi:hypothetical protein